MLAISNLLRLAGQIRPNVLTILIHVVQVLRCECKFLLVTRFLSDVHPHCSQNSSKYPFPMQAIGKELLQKRHRIF